MRQAGRSDLILLVYESANVAEGVFDVVVSFDVVHFVKLGAFDDVFEERDNDFCVFDCSLLFDGEVSHCDELVAVASNVEVVDSDIIGDESASDCKCSAVVLDAELLYCCRSEVLGPEPFMSTFR